MEDARDFDHVVQDTVIDDVMLHRMRAKSGGQIISRNAEARMVTKRSKSP
jgi:hypothetical protein